MRACDLSVVTGVLFALVVSAAADDTVSAEYQALLDRYRPALVTIKYVQKTQGRFGEFDAEEEINGMLVAADGLVVCSNTALTGGGRWGSRSVPTDIKILVGDDAEGVDATFMARDTELDLAWLQLDERPAQALPFLDLEAAQAAAPPAVLGQRVLTLGMMGKYFGREVLVSEGQIAGRTTKPRRLYVVRGGLDTDPGLPIYLPDGRVLGFAAVQQPDEDEMAAGSRNLTARGRGLVLPIDTVVKATARAREIGAEERREAEKAAPDVDPEAAGAAGADDERDSDEQ